MLSQILPLKKRRNFDPKKEMTSEQKAILRSVYKSQIVFKEIHDVLKTLQLKLCHIFTSEKEDNVTSLGNEIATSHLGNRSIMEN